MVHTFLCRMEVPCDRAAAEVIGRPPSRYRHRCPGVGMGPSRAFSLHNWPQSQHRPSNTGHEDESMHGLSRSWLFLRLSASHRMASIQHATLVHAFGQQLAYEDVVDRVAKLTFEALLDQGPRGMQAAAAGGCFERRRSGSTTRRRPPVNRMPDWSTMTTSTSSPPYRGAPTSPTLVTARVLELSRRAASSPPHECCGYRLASSAASSWQ